jgi:hypothetical protein
MCESIGTVSLETGSMWKSSIASTRSDTAFPLTLCGINQKSACIQYQNLVTLNKNGKWEEIHQFH